MKYGDMMLTLSYVILFIALAFAGVCWAYSSRVREMLRGREGGFELPVYKIRALWFFGIVAFLVRIVLALSLEGYQVDMGCFKSWAIHAAEKNLFGFYSGEIFADYPPGYIYILYGLGQLRALFSLDYHSPLFNLLIKLPSILTDIGTSIIIFQMAGKRLGKRAAFLLAGLYAFNPAVLVNASLWGQGDSFFTFFALLSMIFLIREKIGKASVFYAVSFLIKPQAVFLSPVFMAVLLSRRRWKDLLKAVSLGLVTFLVLVLPFSSPEDPFWIVRLYMTTVGQYPYASLNAFNFFALMGGSWKNVNESFVLFSYQIWGWLFILLTAALSFYMVWKKRNQGTVLFACFYSIMAIFVMAHGMHERYLFPALAFLLLAFVHTRDMRLFTLYGGFSVTLFMNQAYVLMASCFEKYHIFSDDLVSFLVSLANVALFILAGRLAMDLLTGTPRQTGEQETESGEDGRKEEDHLTAEMGSREVKSPWTRRDTLLVTVLTLGYFFLALFRLGSLQAPEKHWKPYERGEFFVIDLGKPMDIERVYYYEGLGHGKYRIEYASDPEGVWYFAGAIENEAVFRWDYQELSSHARYIRFAVEKPGAELKEIGLFEKGKKSPVKDFTILNRKVSDQDEGKLENLFDEQDTIEYVPSFMTSTYFDEIYHARTAYEHVHRIEPYENTHPPLGKIFIALGTLVFGMNAFGWRIPGMLFGTAMIPVTYVFARRLFDRTEWAFLAAFLMTFDFMHFAQTRIATIDSFVVLFIMLMYYYMLRFHQAENWREEVLPLFLSGVFFGLACASKWIGIYGGAGLAVFFFLALYWKLKARRGEEGSKAYVIRLLSLCVLFFVLIPAGIYLLSYIPFMMIPGPGHGIRDVFRAQLHMLRYHGGVTDPHPFASPWWSWPLVGKPVWFYMGKDLKEGMMSSIVTMGNPLIWWAGIPAVMYAAKMAWKRRERAMGMVFIALAFQYLPWAFISRPLFIYHFFSCVPFVIFCIVYVFIHGRKRYPWFRTLRRLYMAGVLLLFIMFYPVLSGMVIPEVYSETFLRWFKSLWYF
ncbi:MAG: glycosyltransferase family 39 protein [Clostridia bacterium]